MKFLARPATDALHLRLLAPDGDDDFTDFIDKGAHYRLRDEGGYVLRLPDGTPSEVRQMARLFSFRESKRLKASVHIDNAAVADEQTLAFVSGLLLGGYRHDQHKSDPQEHPFSGADAGASFSVSANELAAGFGKEIALTNAQLTTIRLVDTPANLKTPAAIADQVVASGKRHGYSVTVMDKAECLENNLHALLAVNRGSEDPARFLILEYRGEGADPEKSTAIIGKGVTFDTGGVSIKPSTNLHLMKSDLGGAAATLGTLEAVADLKLPVHLYGIIPVTDNSVDALSIKPSDVIHSHSGKTIEIIDTDAEGRLIMADGLSYAVKNFAPKNLFTVATLTGSAVRTFGYECAACFGNDDGAVSAVIEAGENSGDRCWQLPGWDSFAKGLDSDVADIKNYSGKPLHGATDAFKFLEIFTHDHPRYIHLDIAGVALKQGPFAKDRQGTGFGVRLFVEWLTSLVDE